ncbi:MAG TPA: hypothetical protein IAB44_00025 [Candidatus Limivivens intestinipullorum]|uniref:Uncharacterized protein n=1 Tax=Candidatus Limivivens intestinipullorum TaxID=2840858 RepID=A0A9D1JIE4_9FIRM|nr:hypothetical protein [Candidatus Limivivens intestinipullorum]
MSFSADEIAGMLMSYEADYQTGMNVPEMFELIYRYTSGYPYLVSGICKILDEELPGSAAFPDKSSAWTTAGFYEATATNDSIKDAAMFGFIKSENDTVVISNRIFETVLYKIKSREEKKLRLAIKY